MDSSSKNTIVPDPSASAGPPTNEELPILTFETASDRDRYGYAGLQVLASNNKDCLHPNYLTGHLPKKRIFAMRNFSFGHVYNDRIHPELHDILDSSASSLPKFMELHAISMKISNNQDFTRKYDVVLVVFDCSLGTITVAQAKNLVSRISTCIRKYWTESLVYTDVCESDIKPDHEQIRNGHGSGKDSRDFNSAVYYERVPRPGSSLGNDQNALTSTLGFYVTHDHKTYGVGVEHGVFSGNEGNLQSKEGAKPYQYTTGLRITMVSPSPVDQKATLDRLKFDLSRAGGEQDSIDHVSAIKKSVQNPDSQDFRYKHDNVAIESEISLVKKFDSPLGTVVATSRQVKPPTTAHHRFDWAVIECKEDENYSNKFPPQTISVDELMILDGTNHSAWSSRVTATLTAGLEISLNPSPWKQSDTLLVKPSGARTATRVACFSATVSTLYDGCCGHTTEWAFTGLDSTGPLTDRGDSGGCILSEDGCIVAMIWGGAAHVEYATSRDLTYGTPFGALLDDIKEKLGWTDVRALPRSTSPQILSPVSTEY